MDTKFRLFSVGDGLCWRCWSRTSVYKTDISILVALKQTEARCYLRMKLHKNTFFYEEETIYTDAPVHYAKNLHAPETEMVVLNKRMQGKLCGTTVWEDHVSTSTNLNTEYGIYGTLLLLLKLATGTPGKYKSILLLLFA